MSQNQKSAAGGAPEEVRARAAAKLRAATDAKRSASVKRITLPKSGVVVEIRSVTEGQRLDFIRRAEKSDEVFMHLLIAASSFDPETGEAFFPDGDPSLLREMLVPDVRALSDGVLDVSIITEEAQKAVGNG